ncbi:S-adenosyl-L-methionine-dependent methyltransferase [Schizopora paradoxa]|uniref:S-adenosyl-L-methionine-dependent methyltransferase n=1 Tax=Schizopora paradoxa TaxID=27342 RepID=A0A0H2RQI5_9AGAM|nr:S-adenosyl-L-methionine-dependent methyltransferase [Schizopora paradoxa]
MPIMMETYVPGAHYVLPHNRDEFERLNLLHKYSTNVVCDGRLVFDKNINFEASCCVLDSGAGTGAWAVDLAKKLPDSVEIYAVDISDAKFMPSPPPNVKFSLASVTSLPAEWSSKFDFVAQRYLVAALLAKEWSEAAAEIYRVVKPGGAVQLIEIDMRFPTPETPVSVRIRDVKWKGFNALGLDYGITGRLPDLLEDAGFVDVVDEVRRMPLGKSWGEIGMQGTNVVGGAFRNLYGSIAKAGAAETHEEYEGLIDKLVTEWDAHGSNYPCHVCARKPA